MKTALKPGMTLQGRYKILSLIGKGGMGFVYKVFGLRLNKELAMKEMYDHFVDPTDREKIIKQFQNEAETMAKLNHPGIPRILDTFEENSRNYLVMEFVEGNTLEQVVMENPQYLMEEQVMKWTEQILDIMDYLHNRPDPVIIRDLKPANIMLEATGKIKIIDFGIAKIFDPKDGTVTAIKGSGSAGFAPPEQYGSGGTDHRSDIYALGVTLYYLLSKIIIADSVDRILQGGEVLPPSHYNPLVTPATDSLIFRMIELKPDDRFQNVAEIREFMNSKDLRHNVAQDPGKQSASSLPKTAIRLENQGVIENWKKIHSQTSLPVEKNISTDKLLNPAPSPIPPQQSNTAPIPSGSEREYHFVSEAMLKNRADNNRKKKQTIPSFIITVLFMGIFIFVLSLVTVPFLFKQNEKPVALQDSPKPSPSPKILKLIEKHKEVSGTVSKIEKSDGLVKVQIKSSNGPLTLKMKNSEVPKKMLIGAEIKAEYKISSDGTSKPPWPVISMTVTKSAPAPEPAYNPASNYIPPATYRPVQNYTPPQTYHPPASGGGSGRTSGGGSSQSGSGSGSLTHERPKF